VQKTGLKKENFIHLFAPAGGAKSLRRRKAHFCLPEEAPSLTRRPRTATYKNALSRARFKRSTPSGAQRKINIKDLIDWDD